jgi:hypothetical protein
VKKEESESELLATENSSMREFVDADAYS